MSNCISRMATAFHTQPAASWFLFKEWTRLQARTRRLCSIRANESERHPGLVVLSGATSLQKRAVSFYAPRCHSLGRIRMLGVNLVPRDHLTRRGC